LELLKKEMENPSIQEIIEQDKKDGMTLGITGTPTFFVNGILLEEFGYAPLRELVAKEIEKN
jgi:protein-disulfide isomerase